MLSCSKKALNTLQKRFVAVCAEEKAGSTRIGQKASNFIKQNPRITRLNNGTLVVSQENYSPVTKIIVSFKAGPRFENYDNLGICHAISVGSSLSTKNATQFGITRNLQQLGADLSCTVNREHISYALTVNRDNLLPSFEYFTEVATMQDFKHWEVDDQLRDYLKLDLARINVQPHARAIEALHRAAYRRTLANSLYIDEARIATLTNDAMTKYACEMFTAAAMSISGVGIDHEFLIKLAHSMNVSGTATKPKPAIYYGGEERIDVPSSEFANVILATRSYSVCEKEALVALVLQRLIGVQPHLKYSDFTNTGRLQRAGQVAACNPVQVSCFNSFYSDSGLFGMQIIGKSSDIGPVIKACKEQLSQITCDTISDDILETAKNSLKSSILMELENDQSKVQDLVSQALYYGGLQETNDILLAIDQIDANMVRNVATNIIKGKASFSVVGNLEHVPYLDELEL